MKPAIPALAHDELDPRDYAAATCFAAGHLVNRNAGWRQVRPVIDAAKCKACFICYLVCPDGTVRRSADFPDVWADCSVFVDYDFCKGCGICARECRFGAIAMQPESKAR